MIRSSKESDFPTKQEDHPSDNKGKASTPSSKLWLIQKDPRIVRVSRTFGGKDRHSKVRTIRGLRDRRVRLSVPTAIQLYDLQDRLGLNQPSKVVDWLLNAAKDEIDVLPPLPMLPENFGLNLPHVRTSSEASITASEYSSFEGSNSCRSFARHNLWTSSDSLWKSKSKDVCRDDDDDQHQLANEKESWTLQKGGEEDKEGSNEEHGPHMLLPNHPSFLGLLNTMPFGYNHYDPSSNSSVGNHAFSSQSSDDHDLNNNPNFVQLPSSLSLSTTHSYFPSHISASIVEVDPRQVNNCQNLSSTSQNHFQINSLNPSPSSMNQHNLRPFNFGMMSIDTSKLAAQKDRDFSLK